MVGLLTAAGIYLIYSNALPTIADVRSAPAHDNDVESARRMAAWKSTGLVLLTFLVARDFNSYVISGAALIGADYMVKHANAVNPATNRLDSTDTGLSIAPGMAEAYPMPSYQDDSMVS
jgi:hypothetical protein